MSRFFESEIVRKEMKDLYELQERLQRIFISLPMLSAEEKVEFLSLVKLLIEKQEIMYYRMKLSDDSESQEMIEHIRQSAISLGISPTKTLDVMFKEMKVSVDTILEKINTGKSL